jgi:two-component system chemotaxis response regulator CheB
MESTLTRDLVVVGASAGGVEALRALAQDLPPDFPAAVFVVLHTAPNSPGLISQILDRAGPLPAAVATDGEPVVPGRIYVAPPDHHLLVKGDRVRTAQGPRENRARPAVDPLFRSAAACCGARVIGVVLTGYLDDGASGLAAVKACGGLAIVQDPEDAAYPDMPQSAIEAAGPDHVVPLNRIGPLLRQLAGAPTAPSPDPPHHVLLEARIAERAMSDIPAENDMGRPVPIGCPECGGPLWEVEEDAVKRYRCHVGHGYTAKALIADQDAAVERALWAALRTMEERANMLRTMAKREADAGRSASAEGFEQRATESHDHAQALRWVLLGSDDEEPAPQAAA